MSDLALPAEPTNLTHDVMGGDPLRLIDDENSVHLTGKQTIEAGENRVPNLIKGTIDNRAGGIVVSPTAELATQGTDIDASLGTEADLEGRCGNLGGKRIATSTPRTGAGIVDKAVSVFGSCPGLVVRSPGSRSTEA